MTAPESSATPRLVRFGLFELDLVTGELRKKGVKVALQEQPFQVLAMLLGRPGELVTREELRAKLWGDSVFVDFERGLNKVIVKIRRALDDLAESPRYVETLERRGYRFIAPVEPVQAAGAPATGTLLVARLVGEDRSVPLAEGSHLLGRDPGCAVWIDSSFVSRRHARLVVEPRRLVLEDLGSHNGTLVNGERITAPRVLADGDEIRIGPARLIVYLATPAAATLTSPR
ncbi:MAG: tolB protein [Acidobacteria bacterium]|nr:tolB protein [Acidobacteriota bacterium]